MEFALCLENDRILAAVIALPCTPPSMPRVETLPEGNLIDWLYKNGAYVYDPMPRPEPPTPEPTADDVLNVLLGVTDDE